MNTRVFNRRRVSVGSSYVTSINDDITRLASVLNSLSYVTCHSSIILIDSIYGLGLGYAYSIMQYGPVQCMALRPLWVGYYLIFVTLMLKWFIIFGVPVSVSSCLVTQCKSCNIWLMTCYHEIYEHSTSKSYTLKI